MSAPIYGSIITGFERIGKKEIEDRLKVPCETARGNVRFSLEVQRIPEVFTLRSIDNVYAILYDYTAPGLEQLEKQAALDLIREEVHKINWANAVIWWEIARGKELKGGVTQIKTYMKEYIESRTIHLVTENSPTFRVTCNRAGAQEAHSFSSMDAARVFGGQLNNIFGWRADMKNYDMEIVLNIWKDNMRAMISLNEDSLFKRNVVAFGPTTLRATMCYCMVALAEPKPGDKLLDPLCGGGSIPLEGALAFPGIHFIGGDNHPLAIERCKQNLEHNSGILEPSTVTFSTIDATSLPFEENSFTAIVTDMPFGKKIGSITDNRIIYPKFLEEWQRVVVPEGKAVILTKDKRTIETVMNTGKTSWKMDSSYMVNVGGLSVLCAVLINNK